MSEPVLYNQLVNEMKNCGIVRGDNLSVHVSLSKIGWIPGGPETFIRALLDVVGEEGTIVMPAQTWKNLDPSTGVHWEQPESWWQIIRDNWPAFDPEITPVIGMGVVAEMFRTWPGTIRSNHPARSFCAYGPKAKYIVENHTLENIFGLDSPLEKLSKINGKVLLVGVGFNKNTSLHVAEAKASYKSKHNIKESSAIFINGKREWVTYSTLNVDDQDFLEMESDYLSDYPQKETFIGNAKTMLLPQLELIDWAVKWIEKNRN
ncbi:MAG: AAC(3) family N-acetyltransferase [Spirochaetales bacterium]|nr:AAC(3) family N-acetyltransferase [Spirochaetales bacterium]